MKLPIRSVVTCTLGCIGNQAVHIDPDVVVVYVSELRVSYGIELDSKLGDDLTRCPWFQN